MAQLKFWVKQRRFGPYKLVGPFQIYSYKFWESQPCVMTVGFGAGEPWAIDLDWLIEILDQTALARFI